MKSNFLFKFVTIFVVAVSFAELSAGDSIDELPNHGSKFVRHLNLGLWQNRNYQRQRNASNKIAPRSVAPTMKNVLSNSETDMPTSTCSCHSFIYTFGGTDKFVRQVASVSRLDTNTGTWTSLKRTLVARANAGVAKMGTRVYIIGGKSNEHPYLSSAEVYDLSTQRSTYIRSMPDNRVGGAAAALNGHVYVAGGYNGSRLNSVLRYDPQTDQWEYVKPMRLHRNRHQMASIGGRLYAIAGDNSGSVPGPSTDNVVESYDPATDEWTMVESTRNVHNDMAVTVGDGKIFICSAKGCESYNVDTDRWQTFEKYPHDLAGTTLAFSNNKLYSLGGSAGATHPGQMTVSSYDFSTKQWSQEPDMDLERSFQVTVSDNN